jgi:hypothetical protein
MPLDTIQHKMLTLSGRKAILVTMCLPFTGFLIIRAAAPPKNVDYPYYGGDPGAMRYSTLTQINAKNADQLKEVWRYDLGGPATIENQPIVVIPASPAGWYGIDFFPGRRGDIIARQLPPDIEPGEHTGHVLLWRRRPCQQTTELARVIYHIT